MSKIIVKGVDITILNKGNTDFISLTDMVNGSKDNVRAADVIKNWIRTRGTIEFLGTWETIYNPNFKVVGFDHFKKEAGLPMFTMSVSNWVEQTSAIGIFSKNGKYGGTYAHKDIAFEFGTAISPEFKLLLIKEFQNLKEREQNNVNQIWDFRRFLTKANYRVQTDAIKDVLIPLKNLSNEKEGSIYAEEADLLYKAMYGYTAKQWKENNPDLVLKGRNLRDYADTHQLIVLNSLEAINAELIRNKVPISDRLILLRRAAIEQLKSIRKSANVEDFLIESPNMEAAKKMWTAKPQIPNLTGFEDAENINNSGK